MNADHSPSVDGTDHRAHRPAVQLLPRPMRSVALPTAAPARVVRPEDHATFPGGVGAGSSGADGVTVWTRIDPARVDRRSPVLVEVAGDEAFGDVVVRRAVSAADLGRVPDGTVHVDVRGLLDPGRAGWFRFIHAGASSATGQLP